MPWQIWITPFYSSGDAIAKQKALVYPNPATDVLTVDVSSLNYTNELVFALTDVEGKLVMSNDIANGISRIATKNIAAGIYSYQIIDSVNLVDSGKVIIKR